MSFSAIYRARYLLIATLLLALPFVFYGAQQAWDGNSNRVEDWLPDSFPETQTLKWFVELFGSDELLMISWEDCKIGDPRLEILRKKLLQPVLTQGQKQQLFREVFTGTTALKEFTEGPLRLSQRQALLRMRNWLVSPDGKTTCAIALVSAAGMADRHTAVEYAFQCASSATELSREQVKIAGPTLDGVVIDNTSKQSLLELNLASFLICLVIATICLKSFRLGAVVFLIALFNEQLSMAIVHFTGSRMDSMLLLMANVTYVLSIAIGVHLISYYRSAVSSHGLQAAPGRALQAAVRPTLLASITTAVGFGSLAGSQIIPIAKFGFYSAVAILLATGITLIYLLLHLALWPQISQNKNMSESADSFISLRATSLTKFVSGASLLIFVVSLILLTVSLIGVSRLGTSVGIYDFFPAKSKILQDYQWLENNIGPLAPIEVVLEMPYDGQKTTDRMHRVKRIEQAVREVSGIDATLSLRNFGPILPPEKPRGFRQISRAAIMRKKIDTYRPNLLHTGFLQQDGEKEYWRISARAKVSAQQDYERLLSNVERTLEGEIAEEKQVDIKYSICGGIPLVHKAQDQLLRDLIFSFTMAGILIAVVMMFILRSFRGGLLLMIPNLLPSLTVFGMMGWLGKNIEIGSMMTASAALGIAIDDSLHFLTNYRRQLKQGKSEYDAVQAAYGHCGSAMQNTTLICCFGLLVFSISQFQPIARFAWLMFTLLAFALVCDLIVLPALLLGPFGRFFKNQKS